MVKIILSRGKRGNVLKLRFEHKAQSLNIINTFLKCLKRGISWKLEFIDVDPEEQKRWKNYEEMAKEEWRAIMLEEEFNKTRHSPDSQSGNFSTFPIGMPMSDFPQITEGPKPKVEILSGGHILLVEGEEVTFIIVPN